MAEQSGYEKLVAEAKKNVIEISPEDAAAKLQNAEAVIVDDCEKDEWNESRIPDTVHMSRGTIELDIEEKFPDKNSAPWPAWIDNGSRRLGRARG